MTIHIVVIECEVTPSSILKSHGTQGELIERLLRGVSDDEPSHEADFKFSTWNAVQMQSYPTLDNVDGLFLTGGGRLDPLS